MRTHDKQPQRQFKTLDVNPKASCQASWDVILQQYVDRNNIGQRELISDEEELLQGKFDILQRNILDEEEEPLQGKFDTVQRDIIEKEDDPIQQKTENETGLPDNLKEGVENLSGYSMDDVRVHYNSDKPAQLNALAYAQGTDIHVAPGQENHLSHEVWHVVQQKQGRVKPTMQIQGVNVNDYEGLEKEADSNANSLIQLQIPYLYKQNVTPKEVSTLSPIIQAVWVDTENPGEKKWDQIMDGVTWFSNNDGLMWFDITEPDKIREGTFDDYKELEGKENERTWVEWNKISVKPSIEFTSLEEIAYTNADWQKWDKYISITIAETLKNDDSANVTKDPAFKPDDLIEESCELGWMKEYIDKFKIISKGEYNIKLWEIAERMASLNRYTCIVSEPGKSNFWITARILKRVMFLGGNAPTRIISVPTQEKGIMDLAMAGTINIDLTNAGDVVFLDDGSFSGSQLFKLIQKVIRDAQNQVRLGLVALSQTAKRKIGREDDRYLTTPIPIASYEHTKMGKVREKLGIPSKKDPDSPSPGDHLLGFYYKIPDFASVRNVELTLKEDHQGRTAIKGYSTGTYDLINKKIVGATEPYKSLSDKSSEFFGVEKATITTLANPRMFGVPAFPAIRRRPMHSPLGKSSLSESSKVELSSLLVSEEEKDKEEN